MANFYVLTVNWSINPVHPPLIEGVLGLYADWVRISASNWILYSNHSAKDIGERLHGTLTGDAFLIVKADIQDVWGNAPNWLWSWIHQRMFGAEPGTLPPPTSSVPPTKNLPHQ